MSSSFICVSNYRWGVILCSEINHRKFSIFLKIEIVKFMLTTLHLMRTNQLAILLAAQKSCVLRESFLEIRTWSSQMPNAMTAAAPENSATAKYSFRVIEEIAVLDRVPSHVCLAVPIKGIMKLHFVGIQEGCLKTKTISCLQCLQEASECEKLSVFKSVEQLQALLSLSGSEQSDDEEGGHHDEEGAEVNTFTSSSRPKEAGHVTVKWVGVL